MKILLMNLMVPSMIPLVFVLILNFFMELVWPKML